MQRAPRCGQLLEHRLGERRAVVGIGAGAELVQDHQRALVHVLEHVPELLDERREGREVLRHALVVADDGEDLREDGQAGAITRRERADPTAPSARAGPRS